MVMDTVTFDVSFRRREKKADEVNEVKLLLRLR